MPEIYTIADCQIIKLKEIASDRGSLAYIEGGNHIPFIIKRVYYIYDVPPDSQRAGHAHKKLFQLLVAVSGSFDIHLDDGKAKSAIRLKHPAEGLIVTPMIWRTIDNFSPGAVCLALASDHYNQASYYRDYLQFVSAVNKTQKTSLSK